MRTIIVGAGIAGLWLADKLKEKGNDTVLVLEKNDYIGGRIITSKHGYEIGAGRISTKHKHILALIKRFGLQTVPIHSDVKWKALGDETSQPNNFADAWAPIIKLLSHLKVKSLHSHTLRSLATATLGSDLTDSLLERFGYRAETDTLRADLGIRAFQNEMGSDSSFVVVAGGLSQLVNALAKAKGIDVRLNTTVQDVTEAGGIYYVRTPKQTFECDRVILALPVNALRHLPCIRGFKALEYLQMEPLTRIYAQTVGPLPQSLSKRLITDSPLRYIIPIRPDKGLVMISYMESQDTRRWHGLKGGQLIVALQKELRRLFPLEEAVNFRWARAYEWDAGCSYWIPHADQYDATVESKRALRPFPDTMPHLHLCGESFSLRQAWIEGALEHAASLLALLAFTKP